MITRKSPRVGEGNLADVKADGYRRFHSLELRLHTVVEGLIIWLNHIYYPKGAL